MVLSSSVPCIAGSGQPGILVSGPRQVQPASLTPPLSLQDMTDYVAYVAKDPINQRGEVQWVWWWGGPSVDRVSCQATLMLSQTTPPACHILECCEGLAQSVISTVGQAFELRFKQYLHSPPKVVVPLERYQPPPAPPGLGSTLSHHHPPVLPASSSQGPHSLGCKTQIKAAPPPWAEVRIQEPVSAAITIVISADRGSHRFCKGPDSQYFQRLGCCL